MIYEVIFWQNGSATLLVQADSESEAMMDASMLLVQSDFDTEIVESDVSGTVKPYKKYWSGGPDGDWVEP